jgi:hypothetical protein
MKVELGVETLLHLFRPKMVVVESFQVAQTAVAVVLFLEQYSEEQVKPLLYVLQVRLLSPPRHFLDE